MSSPPQEHGHNKTTGSASAPRHATAGSKCRAPAFETADECFKLALQEPLALARETGQADIVAGIPFYNEVDTVGSVVTTVAEGLQRYYPGQRCVIVAAGAPAGKEALKVLKALPESDGTSRIAFLLADESISGKGWSLRAIMEIAKSLGADLAIVEADLRTRARDGTVEGLTPEWIHLLLEPIRTRSMDLVISRFNRHYFETPVTAHLLYPLLAAVYNCPIHDVVGGQWGISYGLLRTYLQDPRHAWNIELSGYGVDAWLATAAISTSARICEVNLGSKIHKPSPGKTDLVLRRVASVLFGQIALDREWWADKGMIAESPLLRPLPTFGTCRKYQPDEVHLAPRRLAARFRQGFNEFHPVYKGLLPEEAFQHLDRMARSRGEHLDFPSSLWAQIVYHFLLAFAFGKMFARGDLLNSFIPLYEGWLACFGIEMQGLKAKLGLMLPREAEHLTSLEAARRTEEVLDEFLRQKPAFLQSWEVSEESLKPPVPKVTYREFIPHVPLVVPLEVSTPDGKVVSADGIYDSIFVRYKKELELFIYDRLGMPRDAGSQEIAGAVRDFMHRVDRGMGEFLFPGDLSNVDGTRETVDAIFHHFPNHDTFALTPEMASWLLRNCPPINLLAKLGYSHLTVMLQDQEPGDALALASWSEEQDYMDRVMSLVQENARPEHFAAAPLKPLIVDHDDFPSLVEMRESSALSKITGRVVVTNLHKAMGGEFPKLRYFSTIAKNIVEAERFGHLWQRFAQERKEFGRKLANSIAGHWGRDPLSAHNIFENGHQRVLVERLRELAHRMAEESGDDPARAGLATDLQHMADCYHLAFTLPDGTFLPCSAWTWASYSFKGGGGIPTPLSLHVERDWASRDFLLKYYEAAGGSEGAMEEQIAELMEQGREWADLSPILFGTSKEAETVIMKHVMIPEQAPAVPLTRFEGNPVLKPIKEHPWESTYVLNAGALKIDRTVYLVYRAVGEDSVSRLGLAASPDGFRFSERLERPIFEPEGKSEERGCEDPRLTVIGDRIYMLYTAYDGVVAQIALASIPIKDFQEYRWGSWHRHGLVFPGFTDKDATLFPESFEGRFAMLHRVSPHMWITFSHHLRCPWPRREHRILAGARSGMVWDGVKIGAGTQPIKTKFGWLQIYHGIDHAQFYRLGVMVLDLENPAVVLYRSPNSVLDPIEHYEVGRGGKSWVPNVVFTCGAVPLADNRDTLEADDELLVYYGAADTVVGVATGRISDLIPEEIREPAHDGDNAYQRFLRSAQRSDGF